MYKLTESPYKVSLATIMWSLPWSIFGGFIGTLSLQYNNKHLMIAGRTISIVSISILENNVCPRTEKKIIRNDAHTFVKSNFNMFMFCGSNVS